jgi:chromosome segregation ATPase
MGLRKNAGWNRRETEPWVEIILRMQVVSEGELLKAASSYSEAKQSFLFSRSLALFSEKLTRVVDDKSGGEVLLQNASANSAAASEQLKSLKQAVESNKADVDRELEAVRTLCTEIMSVHAEKAKTLENARRNAEAEKVQSLTLIRELQKESEELKCEIPSLQARVVELERELTRVQKEREDVKEQLAPVSDSTKALQAGEYYGKMAELLSRLTK